jgi:hypothetical protein
MERVTRESAVMMHFNRGRACEAILQKLGPFTRDACKFGLNPSPEKLMHLADLLKTAVPAPASRVPRRFFAFILLITGLVVPFWRLATPSRFPDSEEARAKLFVSSSLFYSKIKTDIP